MYVSNVYSIRHYNYKRLDNTIFTFIKEKLPLFRNIMQSMIAQQMLNSYFTMFLQKY